MQLKINCPRCAEYGHFVEVYSSGGLHRCLRCDRDWPKQYKRTPIIVPKKGKVLLCTVHYRTVMEGVDVQMLAVGKPKGITYFKWWQHEPGLAPSRELVTFTKMNNRKGKLEGWFERYTESLLDEWRERKDFTEAFTRLLNYLKQGKTVAISCYCHPLKRNVCHLSILRGLIEDFGYEVEEAPLTDTDDIDPLI
ncbi:hypothetical protein D1872_52210 [compost metagenome]